MSEPSPAVAAEEPLAASIAGLAVDTPWCVTITPSSENGVFDVAVRFVESDGSSITQWDQTMTVVENAEGEWKIVAVQGR
ncbi:hypothetical protein [Rhodococcus pyridinivorans]|uniref:hypothetical protein n=1 Tax=Rhodococcus pyridinivorans TaxID=103816 RepID=UPI00265AAF03|nr:hypothetical protein [Rhodococcus pyridinivorans]